jgi:hypothetical protein
MVRSLSLLSLVLCCSAAFADVTSGPEVGQPVEGFQVEAIVGDSAGTTIDPVAGRGTKTTVYAFVPTDKWSRPCARFLKKLDGEIGSVTDAKVIAVWLTADAQAAKEYLPKAQQSLSFSKTDLTVFKGDASGPGKWGVNSDADATIIVVKDGKATATFGFVSVNDTVVEQVMKAVK